MKIGLAVPCYIDAFFPEAARATLELLERLGHEVSYPLDQTCCGQPMTNSGCNDDAAGAEALFIKNFSRFDAVVMPSGSCVSHIRHKFDAVPQTDEVTRVRSSTYELVEFLHDVAPAREFPWAEFPHRVGLHTSCSALRSLKLETPVSKSMALLSLVKGIQFSEPKRPDECCGFGGTFSVTEEAVSVKMGQDKVTDHCAAGAEYIISSDSSCLMHQRGCAERMGLPVKFRHIAEILNGARA